MSSKYRYNPEKVLFEKVDLSFSERIKKMMPYLITVLAFTLVLFYISNKHFNSPKIKILLEEQAEYLLKLEMIREKTNQFEDILADIQYNDDNIYRTYFEVDPISPSLRYAGFGGNEDYRAFRNSRHYDILTEIGRNLDVLSKKLVVQSKSYDEVIGMAKTKEKRLAARPAIQPVSINELTRFGSAFGMRNHPILKVWKMHEGIDLTAPQGTKIFATADGVVLEAGPSGNGYGNKIKVDHGFGYQTVYGHCYKILVHEGQKVKRGDVIGTVGSTGLSTCPHLHYEVIVNGKKVNPINYYANDVSAEEYDKMIEMLSNADPSFDIN